MQKSNKQPIADIYIRLSSKGQEDGMSRETQEEKCREYCQKHNIIVRNICYENKTGITPHVRSVFQNIVDNQKTTNKADFIVVFCLNRLTRNHVDFYEIKETVENHDTKIVFVKEDMVIQKPFKAHEEFLTDILIANAKFEINHMREVKQLGLINRAKTGIRPGRVPFGYKVHKDTHKILIVPKRAEFVRQAFELMATGEFSLETLSDELFSRGLKYRNQQNCKIPKSSLSSLLKNKFYTGYYTYPNVEGEIKGSYKSIIDRDLYNKVQTILDIPAHEKIKKHTFLYSKMLNLQNSDKLFSGEIKKSKYVYYSAVDDNGKRHYISEETITEAVFNYLKEIRLSLIPEKLVNEVLKTELEPLKRHYATLKRNKSRKYHKKLRLYDFIKSADVDDDDFIADELEKIENEYYDLPERINQTSEKIETITQKFHATMQKRLYDIFLQLDMTNKRKILELVKNKFEIQDKKVKLTFKSAFRKIRRR